MEALVWAGALVSLLGVAGLFYCVIRALGLRRGGLDEDTLRIGLQRVVLINMVALMVSGLGLMLVVVGIVLR